MVGEAEELRMLEELAVLRARIVEDRYFQLIEQQDVARRSRAAIQSERVSALAVQTT